MKELEYTKRINLKKAQQFWSKILNRNVEDISFHTVKLFPSCISALELNIQEHDKKNGITKYYLSDYFILDSQSTKMQITPGIIINSNNKNFEIYAKWIAFLANEYYGDKCFKDDLLKTTAKIYTENFVEDAKSIVEDYFNDEANIDIHLLTLKRLKSNYKKSKDQFLTKLRKIFDSEKTLEK